MRRIAVVLGIIIIVLILAALIFAATFDINKYRGTIQSELEKRLGRSVTVGEMHLGIFPPRFRVQDLAISDDPRFSPEAPFVKTRELDVSVKILPLLHKQIEIRSLNLERPSVNLIKDRQAQWNFASLGRTTGVSGVETAPTPGSQPPTSNKPSAKPASGTQASPENSTGETREQQLSLGELTIEDGQISLLDQSQSKTPTLYDHIDVTLKNFAPDRPFSIDGAAHMAGAGSKDVRIQGLGGPLVEGDLVKTPFHGTLDLNQVGIADLAKFLNSPALTGTDGVMTG